MNPKMITRVVVKSIMLVPVLRIEPRYSTIMFGGCRDESGFRLSRRLMKGALTRASVSQKTSTLARKKVGG